MQLGLQQFLVRQLGLVLRDQRGRERAAERVLDDFVVLAGAEQQADGRAFVGFSVVAVERFEVEIELSQVFGRKTRGLKLDGDQAIESAVEKQQVERKILLADLQGVFAADEAEITTQFEQKLFEPRQQAALQVAFGIADRQVEKFDQIAVLEDALRVRVSLCVSVVARPS